MEKSDEHFITRNKFDVWEDSCKLHNKWGVYAHFHGEFGPEHDDPDGAIFHYARGSVEKYCEQRGHTGSEFYDLVHALGFGDLVLFNSEQEADEVYQLFNDKVMDSSCWFACLISPVDGVVTENT